jgi:hypothetical protein
LNEKSAPLDKEWEKLFADMRANRMAMREVRSAEDDKAKEKREQLTKESQELREKMMKLQQSRDKMLKDVLNDEQEAELKKYTDERMNRMRSWNRNRDNAQDEEKAAPESKEGSEEKKTDTEKDEKSDDDM